MKNPMTLLWQALAFMGLAGVVACIWRSYPHVEPLGQTGAAWVQAVGSILAIIASGAFAIGVPIYLNWQKTQKHRRALTVLLDEICNEIEVEKWRVEVSGQQATQHIPGVFSTLAERLATFPVHELDDPLSIKEVAEAAHYLRVMVEYVREEAGRPRRVWDRLNGQKHGIWQRSVWAKHRFGWGPRDASPEPSRAFGTGLGMLRMFTWDEDGNPTFHDPFQVHQPPPPAAS